MRRLPPARLLVPGSITEPSGPAALRALVNLSGRPPTPELARTGHTMSARAIAVAAALVLWNGPAAPQTIDMNLWGTNGPVWTVAGNGNTIYIGGTFTKVGPVTGGGVSLDAESGEIVRPFPAVLGSVSAVVADGTGGWYIGGAFSAVGGVPRTNLAHILADGSVSNWAPETDPSGYVNALALSGSTVYVGGNFTDIGRQLRNRLAALDATTGMATPWNPNANGNVYAVAVDGATIYVAGEFTTIGGSPRNRIAALDAASGIPTSWNPNANFTVVALVAAGGTVFAGGSFSSIAGQPRNHIAALDSVTGDVTAWNPNANNSVYDIVKHGSTVYAAGGFTTIGGQTCFEWKPASNVTLSLGPGYSRNNHIAALDATTGDATAWNPDADRNVLALGILGGTVYAGGWFSSIGGHSRSYLAALDATTGLANAWDPNPDQYVGALAAMGNAVYAGGGFGLMDCQVRNHIASMDITTGRATAWNPGADATVYALALNGSTVYAGGAFDSIGGQPRLGIAAMDAGTGLVTPWDPNPSFNGHVYMLALSGSTLYVAGGFNTIGGQARNGLAALDVTTALATPWNPGGNGSVSDLIVSEGTVYACGYFSSIGGQPRNNIAALDGTTGMATAWNPSSDEGVMALAVSGSTVYAAGGFSSIGGQSRNGLAALDASTGLATAWNPMPNEYAQLWALALDESSVYPGGGWFTSIGGQSLYNLARLDAVSGTAVAWCGSANHEVRTLAVVGSKVYAGGYFTGVGVHPRPRLAAISIDNVPATVSPTFTADVSVSADTIEVGESAAVTVSVRNDGGLVSDDGRIVVGFPELTGPLDASRLSSTSGGDSPGFRAFAAGSTLLGRDCQPVTASYAVAEYADFDWRWLGEETNTFTLTVTPGDTGILNIDVRSTMRMSGGAPCGYVNALPPNGQKGFTDQQGWPVRRFRMFVRPHPAPPPPPPPPPPGPPSLTWTPIAVAGETPSARSGHSASYDALRNELVLYGGTAGEYLGDTWALPLAPEGIWLRIQPGGPTPLRRTMHTMIHNPVEDHLLIFGGFYDNFLNDLWVLARNPVAWWFPITPPGVQPSRRLGHAAVYDAARHRLLVIGGFDGGLLNDVWEYAPLVDGTWHRLEPTGPPMPARANHSAIYDPLRDRVVVFGGDGGILRNDVWELTLSGSPAWSPLVTSGTPPSARREHTAIYYALWDMMVVYGGFDGARRGDVWSLTLAESLAWQQRFGTTQPVPRSLHSAVYDPQGTRMIVFGGQVGVNAYSSEAWSMTVDVPGPTPVMLALADADATADAVHLAWHGTGAGALSARVERRLVDSEWSSIGAAEVEGPDRLAITDRDVVPETRYGYRLVVLEPEGERAQELVWVVVPARATLALAGASPNPVSGELAVAFTLPRSAPGALELYDLRGRLMARRDISALGAGAQREALADARRLPAGVYLVRLTHDGRILTAKACIVR